tara:strand:+ start:196 stop:612 length:417 start_codon:yes stop_codon:yes gene_type:complete
MVVNEYRLKKDLEQGDICEKRFQEYFKENENIEFIKFGNKYSQLDFRYKNNISELKSRNYFSNDFIDTQIGNNKMTHALKKQNEGYDIDFYFLFKDGLFVWKYDKEIKLRTDYRYNKKWNYVPTIILKKVTDKINSII